MEIPAGAAVSAGTDDGDGTFARSPKDPDSGKIVPPGNEDAPVDIIDEAGASHHVGLSGEAVRKQRRDQIAEKRKRAILSGGTADFNVSPNPNADGSDPILAFGRLSEVTEYDKIIERKSKAAGIDPDIVRAIVYLETTQGRYDRLPAIVDMEKSIRPMNVHAEYWKELGYSRADLKSPDKNIEAGIELLRRLRSKVPNAGIEQLATLYNSLGSTLVSDYGARIAKLYREKPWRK